MPNIMPEVIEANQFIIDSSVRTIEKLKAGFVEANKNYIRNSLMGIVYQAIENFPIFDETQKSNIITLKHYLLNV